MSKMLLDDGDLLVMLIGLVDEAGSQKEAARQLGISPQFLGDVLKGRRKLSRKILDALGYEMIPRYSKVE